MAIHGVVKTIVIFLSLVSPVVPFSDYYNRPTTKMHLRQHVSDTRNTNRYSRYMNDTIEHANLESRSASDTNEHQRTTGYDGSIIYPDTNLNTFCTHGLCVNVTDYPKERIQQLLSRSSFIKGYFEAKEEFVNIDNRFDTGEEFLCETTVHTIYPEKANNTQKEEKFIVNVEGHKQGIVVETCVNNGECKFSKTFPTGYTSNCKQKYTRKRLMVLQGNGQFVFDSFEVPSCCVCVVKKT